MNTIFRLKDSHPIEPSPPAGRDHILRAGAFRNALLGMALVFTPVLVMPQAVADLAQQAGDFGFVYEDLVDEGSSESNSLDNEAHDNQIAKLQDGLVRLQVRAKMGDWPKVSHGGLLRLGDINGRVVELRQRLDAYIEDSAVKDDADRQDPDKSTGQQRLANGSRYDAIFDHRVLFALKQFQVQHGLEADGRVGRQTLRALNASISDRIDQIRVNIFRLQQLPENPGKTYVAVNIPEYKLRMVDDGVERLNMRVVVGKRSNPTPELVDEMDYLVINPYWYVPSKIIHNEILPKYQADPEYFTQQNFEARINGQWVSPNSIEELQQLIDTPNSLRVRQRPGPSNSLGKVKFIFPNPRAIYFHDTPAKKLFNKHHRAYSHGCIRVEQPEALAEQIMALQNGYASEYIDAKLKANKKRRVTLKKSLPVYITYLTAQVNDAGNLQYFPDIYHRDGRTLALVEKTSQQALQASLVREQNVEEATSASVETPSASVTEPYLTLAGGPATNHNVIAARQNGRPTSVSTALVNSKNINEISAPSISEFGVAAQP